MRDGDAPAAAALHRGATFVGPATLRGRMYECPPIGDSVGYPAVVPSDDPADVVHGELFRLHPPFDELLASLDAYEGVTSATAEPPEYRRRTAVTTSPDGRAITAFVYLYERSTLGLKRISSGRFRSS
ncbi:MAG: gamma-glutamylcyclotransferase [Planctomycetes bacterium]|nr:gamma-glutamylcyclotransferase [Planctomycetota bacterium]